MDSPMLDNFLRLRGCVKPNRSSHPARHGESVLRGALLSARHPCLRWAFAQDVSHRKPLSLRRRQTETARGRHQRQDAASLEPAATCADPRETRVGLSSLPQPYEEPLVIFFVNSMILCPIKRPCKVPYRAIATFRRTNLTRPPYVAPWPLRVVAPSTLPQAPCNV